MLRNLTVPEFEAMLTTRVICERLIDRRSGQKRVFYDELLQQGVYVATDILKEIGADAWASTWARTRGNRAALVYSQTRRMMAELALVVDDDGRGGKKNPRFILLSRRGYVRQKTIGDLIIRVLQPKNNANLRRKGSK